MEKTLSEILQNSPWFTEEEARVLDEWAKQYPYAQALQVAAACAAWHLNKPEKQTLLQRAAVHVADRSVLKSWIEKAQQKESALVKETASQTVVESNLADEIMADIESLHEAMKRFESLVENTKTANESLRPADKTKTGRTEKSKKERLLEAVKQLREQQASAAAQSTAKLENVKKSRKKRKSESEALLQEIESRKKVEPENNKTREQLEIIERFIQNNPTITPQQEKSVAEPAADLISKEQQPDFNEHIISETLVEILLQQGKKDKAIEVLKKLIWKFPQKKTYFAARIDELKK
ncbi:MAG: hypothetical protein NZM13_10320 [Cyclobacteriaceae bacterium]|nr:hypothetical protein [Cyclobacteriaceae bacterium]MDW8332171.1 hypothetical protein [Cyclobacteriaceae bacterium]